MENLRILKHARHYIASMAEGINPLTGEYASPDDTVSQERIQKCCAYVAGILDKLIENGGSFSNEKIPFAITPRQCMEVKISKKPIGINDFAKRINAVTEKNMIGISGAMITSWLAENGYLTVEKIVQMKETVKTRKVVNEQSEKLGITAVQSVNSSGEAYERLLYSDTAQKFILNNLDKIVNKK